MKYHTTIQALLAVSTLSLSTTCKGETNVDAVKHEEHATKKETSNQGPNQGKILTAITPHVELLVTTEKHIQFTFLNDKGKTQAPLNQKITVICGNRSAPTVLKFKKTLTGFLSTTKIPEGNVIPTIIRIKPTDKDKTTTIRLNLNLNQCPTCSFKEYACACSHGTDDDHKGHDHSSHKGHKH